MEVYSCKILIGGSRDNEARKSAVPAAEIVMLRHIHGDDSVIEIKHVGSSDISDREIRDLLSRAYGPDDVDLSRGGPALLKEVFGPPGVALPQSVDGVEPLDKPKKVKAARMRWLREVAAEETAAPAFTPPPEGSDDLFAD